MIKPQLFVFHLRKHVFYYFEWTLTTTTKYYYYYTTTTILLLSTTTTTTNDNNKYIAIFFEITQSAGKNFIAFNHKSFQ